MTQRRAVLLAVCCGVALADVLTASIGSPVAVRSFLGLLIVFFVPGHALVCAALSQRELDRIEHVVASVGLSLCLAVFVSVALAALPFGLHAASLAIALAGCTIAASVVAVFRWGVELGTHTVEPRESKVSEP